MFYLLTCCRPASILGRRIFADMIFSLIQRHEDGINFLTTYLKVDLLQRLEQLEALLEQLVPLVDGAVVIGDWSLLLGPLPEDQRLLPEDQQLLLEDQRLLPEGWEQLLGQSQVKCHFQLCSYSYSWWVLFNVHAN